MRKSVSLFALFTLAACDLPPVTTNDMELASYDAVAEAWAASGLPEPSDECNLEHFQVIRTTSKGEFQSYCGDFEKAYGCSEVNKVGGPFTGAIYPLVVIAPGYDVDPHFMVHELLHHFERCTSGRDPWHTRKDVWTDAGGEDSVQSQAMKILEADGWLVNL